MKLRLLVTFLALLGPAFAEDKPAAPAAPAAPATEAPAAAKPLSPTDLPALKENVGKEVTVQGKVEAVGESKSGGVRYLNFSKNYKQSLALVFIVSKGGDAFTKEKLTEFVGKTVTVKGKIETYNEALQIKIEKLEQIVVQP